MRVDGWSKIRETDAMDMPADIIARRSTEKIKKEIMTTAEHDQLSGMKRTEELKRRMAAAAEEEQRVQKEKQYAQERNYGGGFGSGSAYMAREKPEKIMGTGFSGGQRGGFGGQHAQEPQTVQDTDTTLGWKLLRILNAGSGKFFSGVGQFGSKIVGGLEEAE